MGVHSFETKWKFRLCILSYVMIKFFGVHYPKEVVMYILEFYKNICYFYGKNEKITCLHCDDELRYCTSYIFADDTPDTLQYIDFLWNNAHIMRKTGNYVCIYCQLDYIECKLCGGISLCKFLGYNILLLRNYKLVKFRLPPLELFPLKLKHTIEKEIQNLRNLSVDVVLEFLEGDSLHQWLIDYETISESDDIIALYYIGDKNLMFIDHDKKYNLELQFQCVNCKSIYHI